jgi:succinate dehydrogenase / fumarate reductase, cytochrome b subunit
MTSLVLTITETLRYRGKLGQWSWVLHRVAGLGTLLFLILHVIDTSWATFYPELYAKAIAAYQSPLFTLGEFALVACVVYHALNGFRISLFDWRPQWWRHQEDAARMVLLGTAVLLVPTFILMASHVVKHYNELAAQGVGFDLQLGLVIESQIPFVLGIGGVLTGSIVLSGVLSVVGLRGPQGKKSYKGSKREVFLWTFMRVSGVMIIPLVFGHLAMMHILQGVFDITKPGHIPVGTNLGPNLAEPALLAANFVRLRWDTALAGVYIWRIYDISLLVLVSIHGFNGWRYVTDDYIKNNIVRRGVHFASFIGMATLLVVGGLAILQSVPATTEKMLNSSSQAIIQEAPASNNTVGQ